MFGYNYFLLLFEKINSPYPVRLICKYDFCYFEPLRSRLDSNFAKSANMTKKSPPTKIQYGYKKNAKFDADLKSDEKFQKGLKEKS